MIRPRRPLWPLPAVALLLAACGGEPSTADFVIQFNDASLRMNAVLVHVEVTRGGCGAGLEVLYAADVPIDGEAPTMQPPELPKGTYGFNAQARDMSCDVIATACAPVGLPRDDGKVVVTLEAGVGAGGNACAGTEMCAAGRCRPVALPDAGPDSGPPPCDTEGVACGSGDTGICHGGACCFGCYDGSACAQGGTALACGLGGGACTTCSPGDRCVQGACGDAAEAAQFSLSAVNSFLRLGDGTLYSAGDNLFNQRGEPRDTSMPATFSRYTGPLRFADVGGSQLTSCGITKDDGWLYCWGRNLLGSLGTGVSDDRMPTEPQRVQQFGTEIWNDLSGGNGHFCAIRDDGRLFCWGDNRKGQLGLGTTASSATRPTLVVGGATWTRVGDMAGEHTCAIQTDGTLWCWGNNDASQLAQPASMPSARTPQQVGTDADWVAVAAGVWHTCGIRAGGTLWCWGGMMEPNAGQLGLGDRMGRVTPAQVPGPAGWTAVAAGEGHTCGLLAAGMGGDLNAFCWGQAAFGQLGGGNQDDQLAPTLVTLSGMWTQVATGWAHGCGVRGGAFFCWGQGDDGEVGDGLSAIVTTGPVEVTLTPPRM